MAEEFPDQTAYTVVDVGALTFSQWDVQADALARGLVGRGLRPNDRVGLHLDPASALRWLVSYTAVHRAGGVAVPMNPRLAPAEVAHVLAHSGAAAVVADGERVVADGVAGQGLSRVIDASSDYSAPQPVGAAVPVVRWAEVTAG